MNVLDLLLLLLGVSAIIGGYRWGLLARGFSWFGLAVGVLLGIRLVPFALGLVENGEAGVRLFVALITLVVTVSLVSSLGQVLGLRLRRSIADSPLRPFDKALGAVAGGLSLVLLVWVLLPAAAEVPGVVARQVRASVVVTMIRDATPPPPDTVRALEGLVDSSRFPEVFDDLRPAPVSGPPPSEIPVPRRVAASVTESTVNVESVGCGRQYEGSGFAVAEDTIVTNAHVVAGSDTTEVRRPDGEMLDAEVVVFDDDRDLAVLQVDGLGQDPLPIQRAEVEAGGAVIGYPGGQNSPRTAPVRIDEQRAAVGRDIYGEDRTRRQVLFLSARLQQGDSGSAVIDRQGNVVGVVFAISPDQPTTAFALDVRELRAVLDQPREPGSGRCI